MAVLKSKTALGLVPVQSLQTAVGATVPYEYVTEGALAAGDIIQMGPLEVGVKPYDSAIVCDDLDTNAAPTITLTAGILNAAGTDIDAGATAAWIAASTVGQTGGVARATTANTYLSGKSSSVTRQLGIKVVASPATSAGAGKKIALLVTAGG